MAKFLYVYTGGLMEDTPEAQAQVTQAWTVWFGTLGESVVDMGNPFSAGSTVTASGAADGGASHLGGYSIVTADSLAAAASQTEGCPVFSNGGSVEVYEAIPM